MIRGCGFVMRFLIRLDFFLPCVLVDLVVCSWITFFYTGIIGMCTDLTDFLMIEALYCRRANVHMPIGVYNLLQQEGKSAWQ